MNNMGFNTAVFYDIENLLKGYSFSQQMVANLSLKDILETVRQTGKIGQIALQRAYANWSDPRLAIMRGEINELGIDPIQVFGFSRDQKKNAADIQLAIDAIDLAHVRPSLEVFVIVSGDGGFAALAKKLHEYGKVVVGCAYRTATNKTFQAVCDAFVWINDPDEGEEERPQRAAASAPSGVSSMVEVYDPRNVRLAQRIKPLKTLTPDGIVAKTREILEWYARDPTSQTDLTRSGIYLSVIQEAIKYAVPGFQPIRLGFAKFIEYMQYVCKGTDFCIARPLNSQAVLALRSAVQKGVEILPDVDRREVHTPETYRSILATGSPIFRLPSASDFYAVVSWLAQHPVQQSDIGSAIEAIVAGLDGEISSEAVKLALLSLVSANVFLREPEGVSLSEQRLSLPLENRSAAVILDKVRKAARQKLTGVLGEVREEVLQGLIPEIG